MKHNSARAVCAILLGAMFLAPAFIIYAENSRVADITVHVTSFSDTKSEKILNFAASGTDKSVNIALPNGARVLSATVNITSLPGADAVSDYPENLTMDVGNDGALEYAFQGKGYGRMGSQTLFSNGAPYLNVSLPQNGGTNATPSVRLPRNATVTSAVLTISSGGVLGSGGKMLVCGAASATYVQDVQTKLKTFPDVSQVDVIYANSQTPSLDTLKQYSSVLVFSDSGFSDATTLGNNLADYIDAGGGVVTAVFTMQTPIMIGGRYSTGGYRVIPVPDVVYSAGSLGTVNVPNHPIMTNVKTFTTSNYRASSTDVLPGCVKVASFSDGLVLVGTKDINGVIRVDLGFYPPSSDAISSSWSSATDGKWLIHNAMAYSGRRAINCSLDVGNDATIEWNHPALNTSVQVPDVTPQINSYLATAQTSVIDAFGNEFVDVPLAISSNLTGTVQLNNMSIVYQYTTTVDPNPTTGNLAESLNAVLPTKYDQKSTNIPVVIYSSHAGKLKLSNLRIEYVPPVHPAIIEFRTPEDTVVLMDENTATEFCITAVDPYNYPMNTSWTLNGKTLQRNTFNFSWYADFDANGTYNITVTVDNELQKIATSWQVIVRNVNRKPVIDSFSPEKIFDFDENSSVNFEVLASDPDNNAISYTWYLDGKRVVSEETVYVYKTSYSSAGKHEVKVTVLDVLGASTTLSWSVTVKEVNAGPQIADSSPPGDAVTMSENSSKKFSVVDISPDLDKQFITWSLDGNNTGVTGRSYNYSADFNSAGTHVIQAEVTDGKLSEKRIWTVTVTDVNRAPLAIIASPAAKAEFMFGADITFDGSTSSDPDGDQLTMSWSEAGKPLGTGSSLTTKLSKGKHIITLGVDDGKKNGNATAQVELYVRYIDFKGTVTIDVITPVDGQKLVVSARLTNRGDGSVDELAVSFSVDGTEVTTTIIETVEPDAEFPLEFQWKAVKGDHKLEVTVNNQNFSKTVTVAKKPTTSAPVGGDMMPLIAVAVIAVIALVAAAAVMAMRKSRAAALTRDDRRVAARPEAPMAYKSIQKARAAPPAPQARPPPVPPAGTARPVAARSSPPAPAMTGEAKAREAIENLEGIIKDAQAAGLDTTKARQSLKVARNFMEMGKYDKALLHCQNAENNIG